MTAFLSLVAGLVLVAGVLLGWRALDAGADRALARKLETLAGSAGPAFTPEMVAALPEPARRFFAFAIEPGTPLATVVELEMRGEIGLGTKDEPRYQPMQATQVLAPPHGLVWRLRTNLFRGSDGAAPATSWTRFWLGGLVPVVRAAGPDHHRSAFGRVIAEGAFWVPASLLPGEHVRWEPVDANRARAIVSYGGFVQDVELTVGPDGQPERVVIQRWSNANPEQQYREQPFGGELGDFRQVGGYRLPFRVEGGNLIGTPDYFPFFKADLEAIRLPQLGAAPAARPGDDLT
ncbi:DUF6544 family protein [Thioalkalivibrio sp. XN8]|uniref:DUF6544 family protein n=1 Tax=Thioalkalivibrio sp. XN8 TaxID=2712863 RepID=UPI0013EA4941|nr:DUF6544 family protein [Thioalkalivibrio sp. XN8]NGP53660.1 hypothetical protein [Thioalkalivibrio sp. XN8]